jgi:hypothetical protein
MKSEIENNGLSRAFYRKGSNTVKRIFSDNARETTRRAILSQNTPLTKAFDRDVGIIDTVKTAIVTHCIQRLPVLCDPIWVRPTILAIKLHCIKRLTVLRD